MRLKRIACSLLAAGLCVAGPANAAVPTQVSSAAGEIRDFVAVSASVGYAATYGGGLWKSIDSGLNWVKTSLPAKIVWKISANPASGGVRLYAATEQGVFRSLDSGASWTQLTQDPTRAVAVSPGSATGGPDTVLIGVRGAGVYRSTDSGTTFTRQSSGLDSTDVLAIVFQVGSATTAYTLLQCNTDNLPTLSGNFGGVFKTTTATSGAIAWSSFNVNLPAPAAPATGTAPCVNAIAATSTAGGPVIVAGVKDPISTQGGIYFASGAAVSWSTSSTTTTSSGGPYGVEFLGPDFSNANGIFIGSSQFGPWYSGDNGNTFSQIYARLTDPDLETTAFAAGAFTGTVRVAGIGGIGLFRTTMTTSPWNLPTTPIRADRVNDLTNHNGALPNVYFMALNKGGVMRSTDSGASWSEFDTGLEFSFGTSNNNFVRNVQTIAAHPNNGSVVALGEQTYGLYQTNGTTTWTAVPGFSENNPAFLHKPQSMAISPGGKVYYSLFDGRSGTAPGGLYQSIAGGTNIGTLASDGIPLFNDAQPTSYAPGAGRIRLSPSAAESRAFLIVNDSLPYLTTNGGASWARVISSDSSAGGFQRHQFTDLAEKPASSAIVVGASNKGIFRSVNGGVNMSRVAAVGLNQHALAGLVYHSNNVLFGGDSSGQLYCSGDDGVNWQAVSGGNLGYNIRDMKFMDGVVQVVTDGGGIFKKDGVCP